MCERNIPQEAERPAVIQPPYDIALGIEVERFVFSLRIKRTQQSASILES